MAPAAPFLAEWLHRALTGASVHLADFPSIDTAALDEKLERGMQGVRTLSTLGRAARESVGIRVRQPLGTVYAVVPDGYEVDETLLGILRDELNVRAVRFMDHAEDLVSFSAKPNFKGIGKVHGKNTQAAAALDPTVTPELRLEGLARELVNRVQNLRKESGFEVSDRIRLGIFGHGEILDVRASGASSWPAKRWVWRWRAGR
jgi:isoleucyl-tRNA synthetase